MARKDNIGKVADVKKRLEETAAKAAKVKAATEKMELTVHELENTIHEVEQTAKNFHQRIRKQGNESVPDQIHQRRTR